MDDHAAVSPRATVPPHGYRIGSVAVVGLHDNKKTKGLAAGILENPTNVKDEDENEKGGTQT
ncbi:hypothetical protein OUZ56_015927 [Daphnia magna]|uniref:Uncharacterized protein n=1 Tax=Daphnia magna TaxID=35525 RepID=A0ABR0AP58_9CRUS|nr:hypothetical protein OUZ56_015927 [Daphnia magna]